MELPWVAVVGDLVVAVAAGPQDPAGLLQHPVQLLHVLKDVGGEDEIEAVVREGQPLAEAHLESDLDPRVSCCPHLGSSHPCVAGLDTDHPGPSEGDRHRPGSAPATQLQHRGTLRGAVHLLQPGDEITHLPLLVQLLPGPLPGLGSVSYTHLTLPTN